MNPNIIQIIPSAKKTPRSGTGHNRSSSSVSGILSGKRTNQHGENGNENVSKKTKPQPNAEFQSFPLDVPVVYDPINIYPTTYQIPTYPPQFPHPTYYNPSEYYGLMMQRSISDFASQSLPNVCLFSSTPPSVTLRQSHSDNNLLSDKASNVRKIIEGARKWQPTKYDSFHKGNNQNGTQFVLLSYNVLAQDLLTQHSYLYRNHNPKALLWEVRWRNLLLEINSYDPDIMCLQEVQESHLQHYYSYFLKNGYRNLFKKRTGNYTDGCALYYKKSKFKLLQYTTVEYKQSFYPLDRDNIAIVAKFAPVDKPDAHFVVATTHLLFNPRRTDVRVAQMQVLLTEIDRIAYDPTNKYKYVPVIMTGDLNAMPDSAVYELIVKGRLEYENLTNKTFAVTNSNYNLVGKRLLEPELRITDSCQHFDILEHRAVNETLNRKEQENVIQLKHSNRTVQAPTTARNDTLFSTGTLTHNLKLNSVFIQSVGNDTEGTTDQSTWITVDYIFYSGSSDPKKSGDKRLKLLSRYTIPKKSHYKQFMYIPNMALGSDHLALVCKFQLD